MPAPDTFMGFPSGRLRTLPAPHFFFTDLMPLIDDIAELKLTLYCLYLLDTNPPGQTWIWTDELRRDPQLLAMMDAISALYEASEVLEEALQRAVQRHALLRFTLQDPQIAQAREALALNTVSGRQLRDAGTAPVQEIDEATPTPVEVSRPFQLYQQNIGLLTPLVADRIRDLEAEYPVPWICEAMAIAVHNNRKSLAYVEAILERWDAEGHRHPDDKKEQWELTLDSS